MAAYYSLIGKAISQGQSGPVNISDVARRAGVSVATVSRALNGLSTVDPALAERVMAAVADLDYRPSRVARNLRGQSSTVWGIVVADIGNPFFTRIVRAIQDEAWAVGRTVIVCNTDEDLEKERRAIDVLVAERVGGVLIAPASESETDVSPLIRRDVPVVALDRLPSADVDSVLTDNFLGGRQATQYLVGQGLKTIGCITGPFRTTTARERLMGYRAALLEAGITPTPEHIVHADFREEGGRLAAIELLDGRMAPEGIFVANNLMTLGVLRALEERGRRVPDDLAVVGFDELPWAGGLGSRVPVITQPAGAMAEAAARMLSERVAGFAGPPRHIVLEPRLRPAA